MNEVADYIMARTNIATREKSRLLSVLRLNKFDGDLPKIVNMVESREDIRRLHYCGRYAHSLFLKALDLPQEIVDK